MIYIGKYIGSAIYPFHAEMIKTDGVYNSEARCTLLQSVRSHMIKIDPNHEIKYFFRPDFITGPYLTYTNTKR